jgi:hypothetical protein
MLVWKIFLPKNFLLQKFFGMKFSKFNQGKEKKVKLQA